ncbi:MAG: hypothetical protein V3U20_04285 [Thermoplasmata archaeon]
MQKKALVGTILSLIALIMIGLSLMMPWFAVEYTTSAFDQSFTFKSEYYFDHATVSRSGTSEEFEIKYDDENVTASKPIETIKTLQIIVYLGIIGCILGMIGAALVASEKMSAKVGAVLVLLAVILSLLAPFYIMFALPAAIKDEANEDNTYLDSEKIGTDFFGSAKVESNSDPNMTQEITWGGGLGWFFAIIAMVMCVIALPLVAKSKPAPEPIFQGSPMPFETLAQPEAMLTPTQGEFYPDQAKIYPQVPPLQPIARPQGEEFQCPECWKIFILATTKRPAILKCPYCGLEGLVE